jgi:serine protease Do
MIHTHRWFGLLLVVATMTCPRHATANTLHDLERDIGAILEKVSPQVVTVRATFQYTSRGTRRSYVNVGSGVLVNAGGYILTASGVVTESRKVPVKVTVTDSRDSTYNALLFGVDEKLHVAILRVGKLAGTAPPERKTTSWEPGKFALVVGSSFGVGPSGSLTTIGGKRSPDGFWLLSAAATPGMSGAPVFDSDGRWGGIIVGKAGQARGSEHRVTPAVMESVEQLQPVINRIARLSAPEPAGGKPWLGMSLNRRVRNSNGQLVISVSRIVAGGPAIIAGIQKQDVIVGIDNIPIYYFLDLAEALQKRRVGQTITLHVLRGGEPKSVPLVLATRSR